MTTSARRVLVATAAVTTACVLPSFLLGAMAVQVGRDLGFDTSGVGLAFAAFFAAASLASAPLGRVTESHGPVWSLRLAAGVSAAACLVVAGTARSLLGLVVPLSVAGAANALCQPAANLLIARSVPAHRQGVAFAVKGPPGRYLRDSASRGRRSQAVGGVAPIACLGQCVWVSCRRRPVSLVLVARTGVWLQKEAPA